MPRTRECDFCGADIEPGTGTMFVSIDGTTTHYCSSKCEKNADLGREARDVEWTDEGHAQGGTTATEEPVETTAVTEDESTEEDEQMDDTESEPSEEDVESGSTTEDEDSVDADTADAESDTDDTDDDETEEAEA